MLASRSAVSGQRSAVSGAALGACRRAEEEERMMPGRTLRIDGVGVAWDFSEAHGGMWNFTQVRGCCGDGNGALWWALPVA